MAWLILVNFSLQRMPFPYKDTPEVEGPEETPGTVTTQLRLWDFYPEQFQEANGYFLDIFVMDKISMYVWNLILMGDSM